MGQRVRFVLLFLSASICSMYAHELGHAASGWVQEIPVFPSPAKEYVLLTTIEWHEQIWIAFGGPAVTAIVVSVAILWASRHRGQASCAILAGVLVEPAFYVIRTLLVGRGHDGLEWQEAQSAIGLDPNGHALDVLFVFLFFAGLRGPGCSRRTADAMALVCQVVFARSRRNHCFDPYPSWQ
jgi:hypothetical protein